MMGEWHHEAQDEGKRERRRRSRMSRTRMAEAISGDDGMCRVVVGDHNDSMTWNTVE
jgi:hypothetical protein